MMRLLLALFFATSAIAATFTDMTVDGVILSETSTHNELYQSFYERYRFASATTNETTFAQHAPGWEFTEVEDPASSFSFGTWLQMQYWVEWSSSAVGMWSMCTNAPSQVGGLADLLLITNTAQVFAAAGMSTNGWRKATVYDPDIHNWEDPYDEMWTNTVGNGYGKIAEGDIFGPWILDDLQRSVDVFRMRLFNSSPPSYAGNMVSAGSKNRRSIGVGFGTRTNSYAGAVALIQSQWPTLSPSLEDNEFPSAFGTSIAYTNGDVQAAGYVFGPNAVEGILIGPVSDSISIHVYANSTKKEHYGGIVSYSAMGTGLIETNFAKVVTDVFPASTTNRTLTTSGFGYSYEDCPEIPTPVTEDGSTSAGYDVTGIIVLIAPDWPYTR